MEKTNWEKFVVATVKATMKKKEQAGDTVGMSVWKPVKDDDTDNQP
jgi:hypothetical protein